MVWLGVAARHGVDGLFAREISSCAGKNKVGVTIANISHHACPSDISNWIAKENLLIIFATH